MQTLLENSSLVKSAFNLPLHNTQLGFCVNGSNPQGENTGGSSVVECVALQNDPQGNAQPFSVFPISIKNKIVTFEIINSKNGKAQHLGKFQASQKTFAKINDASRKSWGLK